MDLLFLLSTPTLIVSSWYLSFLLIERSFDLGDKYLNIGTSWFLFYAFLVSLNAAPFGIKLVSNAPLVPLLLLILSLLAWKLYVYFKKNHQTLDLRVVLLRLLGLSALFVLIFSIQNVWIEGRTKSVLSSIGSLHTGKYVYLAEYISQCSTVPLIKNNIGQSMVSYTFMEVNGGTHTYNLVWLLTVSIAALVHVAIGLMQIFLKQVLDSKLILMAILILLSGNFALSFSYVLANDSGNPILLVGYADTLFGIFALFFLGYFMTESRNYKRGRQIIVLSMVFTTLFFSSPQTLVLIPIIVLYFLVKRQGVQSLYTIFSLFLSFLFWRGQSGLLSYNEGEGVRIPGISPQIISNPLELGQEVFSPGYPFLLGSFIDVPYEIAPRGMDSAKDLLVYFESGEYTRAIWSLEQLFLSTIRPLFWPLLGIIIVSLVWRKTSNQNLQRIFGVDVVTSLRNNSLVPICLCYLAVTLPIVFLFKLNQMKWEMTRISFPALTAGMLFLTLFVVRLYLSISKKMFVLILVFVITAPTILHSALLAKRNISHFSLETTNIEIGEIGMLKEVINVKCNKY